MPAFQGYEKGICNLGVAEVQRRHTRWNRPCTNILKKWFGEVSPRMIRKCPRHYHEEDFWVLPYFLLNFSTRPAVSTSFCFPVKKGWQLEQISVEIFLRVERVGISWPHAQWMTTS